MKSYDAERAAVQPGTVKNARQALLGTWKPLCDLINGLAIVTPSDELESLIAEMNTRIQSKKTALKQRKSTKKTAKEAAQDVVDVEELFFVCRLCGVAAYATAAGRPNGDAPAKRGYPQRDTPRLLVCRAWHNSNG